MAELVWTERKENIITSDHATAMEARDFSCVVLRFALDLLDHQKNRRRQSAGPREFKRPLAQPVH